MHEAILDWGENDASVWRGGVGAPLGADPSLRRAIEFERKTREKKFRSLSQVNPRN